MGFKKRVSLPVLSPWQRKALTALDESIAHWDRLATGKRRRGEQAGPDDCPCCIRWLTSNCRLCPVAARAGETSCSGTPYWDSHWAAMDHGIDSREFRTAAAVERDWLIETRDMVRAGKVQP